MIPIKKNLLKRKIYHFGWQTKRVTKMLISNIYENVNKRANVTNIHPQILLERFSEQIDSYFMI